MTNRTDLPRSLTHAPGGRSPADIVAYNFIVSVLIDVGPRTVAQTLTDAGYAVDDSGRLCEKIAPCDRCGIRAHLTRRPPSPQFLCLSCRLAELERQDARPSQPPGPGITTTAEPGTSAPGSASSSSRGARGRPSSDNTRHVAGGPAPS